MINTCLIIKCKQVYFGRKFLSLIIIKVEVIKWLFVQELVHIPDRIDAQLHYPNLYCNFAIIMN